SNRSIEHATECPSVDDASMNSESDDAPSVLIHDHQHPVRPQGHRFTSEQINAVKAIFRVTDEGEPGRSVAVYRRMVVGGKNPADHILINRDAESQGDLFGNTRTSPIADSAALYRQPHELNRRPDPLARVSLDVLAKTAIGICAGPE